MMGVFDNIPAARLLTAADPAAVLARAEGLSAFDGMIVASGAQGPSAASAERAQMRALLFSAGFLPVGPQGDGGMRYLRSSLAVEPAIFTAASDDIVSMTDLGRRGRFGNQLFQYAFLKLYGLRNHAAVATSSWDGERIFSLKEARAGINRHPDIVFDGLEDDDLVLWRQDAPPVNVNFSGYFQELPPDFFPHRQYLRRLLSLRPDWQAQLQALLASACPPERTLVSIHARRGDTTDAGEESHFAPIPLDWYRDLLRELWPRLSNPILHVATDGGAAVLSRFSDFPRLEIASPAGMPDFLPDFFLMRSAAVLAIANSSFSRMAALLAPEGQRCFVPSRAQKRFLPYSPWEDRAFWPRFLPPGAEGDALFRLRARTVALRIELGRLRHGAAGGALALAAGTTAMSCKVCGGSAPLFGVCDFESWGARCRPLSGKPVYYRRCGGCGMVFTNAFDDWTGSEFQQSIYNETFLAGDPDFVMTRPSVRARHLSTLFPGRAGLSVLDYGAVNHATVETLKAEGFATERFDYFDSTERANGPADIVTCFDLLERTPEPEAMAADLARRLKPGGVIVFTAAMLPPDAADLRAAGPAPRAGQIALYTEAALERLWSRLGFKTVALGNEWHLAFRTLPDFAAHLA